MSREQFDEWYESIAGCLSTKSKHWETWKAAQEALLAAHGPAVEIKFLQETAPIDQAAWERLGRKG